MAAYKNKVRVAAHRGNSCVCPENTLVAMRSALELPVDAYGLADALTRQGYVPGFPVGRYYPGMDKVLLVACTEKHSREQIGVLAELMGAALRAQTTKGGLL